ncbi:MULTISPECIES: DivIVA domain-containing protein [Citricoccus]|uniref:DivIVA domain-containing protein n=1 Tax=Citricoccus TaxID=169133 RepID=UPI00058AEF01|nr:DivIVA domain-containing protein [Citricoccus sp. CH26A]
MALTPEDVVNKRFQPTKFREGYDQDEVDDFLDEIVVELRRLNQENDELRRKVAELQSGGASGSTVPAPVSAEDEGTVATGTSVQDTSVQKTSAGGSSTPVAEAASTEDSGASQKPAASVPAAKDSDEVIEAAPAVTPAATADTPATAVPAAPAAVTGREAVATSAAGVLAMAQKLHDDFVAEGEAKREQIIADAQSEADGLVNDAQEKSRKTLAELEEKKSVLERKVEQLKGFERDYRARLKAYIEGQLRDLQSQGPIQDEVTATS